MTFESGSCSGADKEGTGWNVPMERSGPWLAFHELQSMNQSLILSASDRACETLACASAEQYAPLSYGNRRVPITFFPFFFFFLFFPPSSVCFSHTAPPVLFIPEHAVHKYVCALAHVYSISKCIWKWLSTTLLSCPVEAAQCHRTHWLCFGQPGSKDNKIMCLGLWVGKS